jgi:hypothetical protein
VSKKCADPFAGVAPLSAVTDFYRGRGIIVDDRCKFVGYLPGYEPRPAQTITMDTGKPITDKLSELQQLVWAHPPTAHDDITISNALFAGDDVRVWKAVDGEPCILITSTHVEYAVAEMDREEVGRLVAALVLWLATTH